MGTDTTKTGTMNVKLRYQQTTILCVLFSMGTASAAQPLQPDGHTLFLAHFDNTANADHSHGNGLVQGDGRLTKTGRFGGGLQLKQGQSVSYSAQKNFFPVQGTIEFWIQPQWNGSTSERRAVFGISLGASNYLNINKLADGRFGVGMSGRPTGKPFVYRRADEKVLSWKAGQWHHVAVTWRARDLSLWMDGRLASRKTGALPPVGSLDRFRFFGSNHVLDEICISDIVRYRGGRRVTGRPVAAQTHLHSSWKFNEPADVYQSAVSVDGTAAIAGMAIIPKNYLDDVEPTALPKPAAVPRIDLFAAPDETEPAAFVIVAEKPLKHLSVRVSDLRSGSQRISARQATVRRVVRTPMRRLYTLRADQTAIVNRFLPRWKPIDLPAGSFREVWLSVRVPRDQPPGDYVGRITLSHSGRQRVLPIRLRVLPIRLVDHPRKQLGCYYRMTAKLIRPRQVLRELKDLRTHGAKNLVTDLRIQYHQKDGGVVIDSDQLRLGLDLIHRSGWGKGTIVVGTGFTRLAVQLGHRDVRPPQTGASLAGDTVFLRTAKAGMQEILKRDRDHADLRLVATHMDEVFGRGRLPLYLQLSRAARQLPDVPLYITFNTARESANALRIQIDPFVDIRGNHGYSFEQWLTRGHTIDEYEAELARSGDVAWFYHNARGTYFTAEWSRIVNGLYLWAGPFTSHTPWTYQAYHNNPFDDTDGPVKGGHDFGLSFPGQTNSDDLVPTRLWEAMREGGDDIRYLATLEDAIRTAPQSRQQQATEARQFLVKLKGLVRNARLRLPAANQQAEHPGNVLDFDSRLLMEPPRGGTAAEAPLVNALAHRFTGSQWQQIRRQIADRILRLKPAR